MSKFIPKPRRVPVGVAVAPIAIDPDLYMTIVNVGWSPLFINLSGQVAAVDRGVGDNIEIPPNGNIPNIPPLGILEISGISDQIPGFVLLTFSNDPQMVPVLALDNPRVTDDFNYTAVNDNANAFYLYATFVGVSGHRVVVVVVEAVTNDVLMTFDGTAPVRIGLVGHYLAAGDVGVYTVDSFVDLLAMNVVAGLNVNTRGGVYGF